MLLFLLLLLRILLLLLRLLLFLLRLLILLLLLLLRPFPDAPHSPLRSFSRRLVSIGAGRLRLQAMLVPPDPALGARPIDHRRRRECGQALQPVAAVRSGPLKLSDSIICDS